ncbi:hypothetical protein [Shewanella sp. Iso12]|uniref:hypothetical protein n=1 Tax=Shewanella sp. Iso12 TaxID=1826753 RepID=UPI00142F494B|nr:hypothetical protein [Shewanella sp. Iso12]NJI84791.1 hypothetical protein [Shewanella sp. Iso12]
MMADIGIETPEEREAFEFIAKRQNAAPSNPACNDVLSDAVEVIRSCPTTSADGIARALANAGLLAKSVK